jgi:four helix bundle protein
MFVGTSILDGDDTVLQEETTMRDHKKLKAFQLADVLALKVYKATAHFPKEEQYGLKAQLRKSAVSTPSNIVEGCARNTEADYLRFLDIAFGSSRELEYQVSLAFRLGYLGQDVYKELEGDSVETSKVIGGLIRSLRR